MKSKDPHKIKINLKYFQTNLDLRKLLKQLNKTSKYIYNGNRIYDKIIDSTKELTEFQKLLISSPGDLSKDKKQERKLFNLQKKIANLSRKGKLLPTINNNFKFVKQIRFNFYRNDYHLTCTYSKLNKTYYMEVYHRGYAGGVGILNKSKNKLSVLRKMDQIKKLAINKNILPGKYN